MPLHPHFLMPESRLRARVRPGFDDAAFGGLALELMVSPSALAIRLERLNFIDSLAAGRWGAMSAAQAARSSGDPTAMARATAYATEPRRPGLLSRDLFAAYVDGRTTLRPYASLLGVDTATLRAETSSAPTRWSADQWLHGYSLTTRSSATSSPPSGASTCCSPSSAIEVDGVKQWPRRRASAFMGFLPNLTALLEKGCLREPIEVSESRTHSACRGHPARHLWWAQLGTSQASR